MTISSMTGFARTAGKGADLAWIWEVKAVNGRNLDIRCRLPSGLEALEVPARRKVGEHLSRGSVTVSLNIRSEARDTALKVNRVLLDELIKLAGSIPPGKGVEAARLDGLLRVSGVITQEDDQLSEDDMAARDAVLLADLDVALDMLQSSRSDEGRHLADILADRVAHIEKLTAQARACDAASPEAIHQKYAARIADFTANLEAIDPARLAQEAAVLATKADIREELDRLDAHVQAAQSLLGEKKPVGRRLDFLAQEFNREANTLCSKSSDSELTGIGLELKATIDQFREQVQNVE